MIFKEHNQLRGLVYLNFPKKMQGGFTLLETMVAIAILLIAVVGPISLIGGAPSKVYFVRDQAIAVNLAQEGIEVVRQKRDTNLLVGGSTAWDSGFGTGDCTSGGYQCLVDVNPLNITRCNGACGAGDNTRVYQSSSDLLYHQYVSSPTGTHTNFRRVMSTNKVNNNEYTVIVNVTWTTGNIPGSITVSESIFNWTE